MPTLRKLKTSENYNKARQEVLANSYCSLYNLI